MLRELVTTLALVWAVTATGILALLWMVALRWQDGILVACVDCGGEGYLELVLWLVGWGLSTAALTWRLGGTRS